MKIIIFGSLIPIKAEQNAPSPKKQNMDSNIFEPSKLLITLPANDTFTRSKGPTDRHGPRAAGLTQTGPQGVH